MGVLTRREKGSPLTWEEVDNNWDSLTGEFAQVAVDAAQVAQDRAAVEVIANNFGDVAGAIAAAQAAATAAAGSASSANTSATNAANSAAAAQAAAVAFKWGNIPTTPAITNQTDLMAQLNAREPSVALGNTLQYYRGDKSWATLNSTAVGLGQVPNLTQAQMLADIAKASFLGNKVGNFGYVVNARGSGTVTADTAWITDRYQLRNSGTARLNALAVSTGGPASGVNNLLMTVTSAGTPSAAEFYGCRTGVEAQLLNDLQWGTAAAVDATLTFEFTASVAGFYSVAIINAANNFSFVQTFQVQTPNTWATYSVPIPATTTGTWDISSVNLGLTVNVIVACGTTNQTATLGAWQASSKLAGSTATQLTNTAGATARLGRVDLRRGSFNGWWAPDVTLEQTRCARYYQQLAGQGVYGYQSNAGSTFRNWYFKFPVNMRNSSIGVSVTSSPAGVALVAATPDGLTFNVNSGSTTADVFISGWQANNEII